MNFESTPYSTPQSQSVSIEKDTITSCQTSRMRLVIFGGGIGLCIGIMWTIVFGPLTDGPPSISLSFLVYSTGLTITGLTVGIVRRLPGLVGSITGLLTLSTWAVIVGPKDGWGVLWLMVFGGSGLFWGAVIGFAFWLICKRNAA